VSFVSFLPSGLFAETLTSISLPFPSLQINLKRITVEMDLVPETLLLFSILTIPTLPRIVIPTRGGLETT